MLLVQLTSLDGSAVLVNLSNAVTITDVSKDVTEIVLLNENVLEVKETAAEILAAIES